MKDKITVLVADDHAIVRAGIASVLGLSKDIEVVGEAANGRLAVRKAKELRPTVVIMDLMMPVMNGVEATSVLSNEVPETKVLVLTTYGFSDEVAAALKAGALGAIIKTASNTSLVSAIRAIAAGRRVVAPEIEQTLKSAVDTPQLTDRQKAILDSITRGLANKQIADKFGISLDGVKGHIRRICTKIGASNRAEAIAIAIKKQLMKI